MKRQFIIEIETDAIYDVYELKTYTEDAVGEMVHPTKFKVDVTEIGELKSLLRERMGES